MKRMQYFLYAGAIGRIETMELPMYLQQINEISAKALKTFLHTLFDISSINPHNLCILTNVTWPFRITTYFCSHNNLSMIRNNHIYYCTNCFTVSTGQVKMDIKSTLLMSIFYIHYSRINLEINMKITTKERLKAISLRSHTIFICQLSVTGNTGWGKCYRK